MAVTTQNIKLRSGYKQTEVGVIPEEWDVKPLKHLSPRQCVGVVVNPSSYFDDEGTVPFLVGSNVGENSINWRTAKRISDASNQLLGTSRLAAGDLVTVRVGEPGVTAVIPPELDGCNCASMMIVRQHPSFDSHWLCWVMNSRIGRLQVGHVQYGTAQKQFNISDAVDFCYPVPPLPEQRAIAAALTDVDNLIASLDALIAKKCDIKQGAMQQLLTGRTRLPGFGGSWEVKLLGEVAEIVSGGTPRTSVPEFWDGDVKWCTPTDITRADGKYLTETERCISEAGLKHSSATLLPVGSLLLCSRATIGEIRIARTIVCTNQGFKSLVCSKGVSNEFLYYLMLTKKSKLIEKAIGSTFLEISKKDTASIEIALPAFDEQLAIAEVLSDMDSEIAALERRRDKTQAVKQGMMQQLLTGKTRLL